jgi:hypothetical protein
MMDETAAAKIPRWNVVEFTAVRNACVCLRLSANSKLAVRVPINPEEEKN